MVAEVFSAMIQGIEGQIVKIQVDISNGLPNFNMIGYLSNEVKESKERVRTALNNIGVLLPPKRISVNFAPADFRKCGTSFDIGVAAAILLAMDFVPETYIKDTLFVYNLNIFDTLIHELTHAYQEYLSLSRNTLFTRIMKDGDNVQSGKFKYKKSLLNYLPKEVRGRVFYCEHHDIMPFELHANNVASMYCLKVYQEMKNLTDISSYESILLDNYLKEYSFENEIINPLTKFYIYSNTLDIMNSHNLKNLSSRNKFLLGYLRTALEINETFNKVMNTKNLDYVRIYKNGSVYKNE